MTDRPTNRIASDPRTQRVYSQYPDESSAPTQASSLAWSVDDQAQPDPGAYYDPAGYAEPAGYAPYPGGYPADAPAPGPPWYRQAPIYLAGAALVAVLAAGGGLAYVLTSSSTNRVPASTRSVPPAAPKNAP